MLEETFLITTDYKGLGATGNTVGWGPTGNRAEAEGKINNKYFYICKIKVTKKEETDLKS